MFHNTTFGWDSMTRGEWMMSRERGWVIHLFEMTTIHNRVAHAHNLGIKDDIASSWMKNSDEFWWPSWVWMSDWLQSQPLANESGAEVGWVIEMITYPGWLGQLTGGQPQPPPATTSRTVRERRRPFWISPSLMSLTLHLSRILSLLWFACRLSSRSLP